MVNTKIRLIISFAPKDGEALYRQQKQDRELTVAQIMNSLLPNSDLNWRKYGKTTRPFWYDINQILYDYTVEVTNRFKGLDLIEYMKNYGWRFVTLYRRQGSTPSPRKEMQKGKMVVLGGLTNSWEKREAKGKGEEERYTHLKAEFQRTARKVRKPSSVISAKK